MSDTGSPDKPRVNLADFQQLIKNMYLEKDLARGVEGTFIWFMEEIGELATSLRAGTHEERLGEFADVLAWLTTIANVVGIDLFQRSPKSMDQAVQVAISLVCTCPDSEKP
ncbi:MAG: nucleotide pyrophosphohydrolase [Pirellulales bacterium]